MHEKVVVLGASEKPERFSNKAVRLLKRHGHDVLPVGLNRGRIGDVFIVPMKNVSLDNVDTVSIYLSPENQKNYYESVLKWRPKRVIFNPGAENREFRSLLEENDIEVIEDCTLLMLAKSEF